MKIRLSALVSLILQQIPPVAPATGGTSRSPQPEPTLNGKSLWNNTKEELKAWLRLRKLRLGGDKEEVVARCVHRE